MLIDCIELRRKMCLEEEGMGETLQDYFYRKISM